MSDELKIEDVDAFMRISEAAAMLKVCTRTIRRVLADGQLKAVRVRACTRVYRSSVEAYLRRNELGVCI